MNTTYKVLAFTFLLAGFSQISYGNIRPSNIVLLILFGVLAVRNYFKFTPLFIFIIFSIIYAYIIGGFLKPITFVTETLTFSIFFSLIRYFKRIDEFKISKLLTFFNYSMFLSNSLALVFLLILPQFRDLVIDTSSLGFRLKGFFGQPNGYALILLISFPISTYIFIKKRNLLNLIFIIVSFTALIFTQSRGAILGLFLSVCIVVFLYILYNNPIEKLRKFTLPVVLIISVIFMLFTVIPEYVESNFGLNLSRINPLKESTTERSIAAFSYEDMEDDRFYLINNGFKTLVKYPWGLGYKEQHLIIGEVTGRSLIPHNYYLNLLLDFGLLLGLIWNLIIVYIIFKGFKFFKKNKISHYDLFFYLHIMVLSVAIYYLTHSPKWSYLYIIFAIYISYIFPPKLNRTTNI